MVENQTGIGENSFCLTGIRLRKKTWHLSKLRRKGAYLNMFAWVDTRYICFMAEMAKVFKTLTSHHFFLWSSILQCMDMWDGTSVLIRWLRTEKTADWAAACMCICSSADLQAGMQESKYLAAEKHVLFHNLSHPDCQSKAKESVQRSLCDYSKESVEGREPTRMPRKEKRTRQRQLPFF